MAAYREFDIAHAIETAGLRPKQQEVKCQTLFALEMYSSHLGLLLSSLCERSPLCVIVVSY